jgi:hypothetical protein
MTIRFTASRDGYAIGSVVSTLSVLAEAAYVAGGYAEYDTPRADNTNVPVRRVLGSQSIPCILAPSGTIATAGTVTLGTAVALTYPRAWVHFPAGAVVGGLAGWYYCVFTTTTAGTVYTAFQATMEKPYIPSTLTVSVGSNAAYTAATGADVVMGSVVVPASMLGQFGQIDVHAFMSYLDSANDKISKLLFGGSAVVSLTATTTDGLTIRKRIANRHTNQQVIQADLAEGAASGTTATFLAIDTTADVVVAISGQKETATEYMVLESFSVEVLPTP